MTRKRGKDDGTELVRRDGALALTFVNTGSRCSRRLRDYSDLLRWSAEHGALTPAEAMRLDQSVVERPEAASDAFAAAEAWHALLARILNARADRKAPSSADLRDLNALVARTVPSRILAPGRGRPEWIWPEDPERAAYRPLWPIALSATTILTSDDYDHVRRCAGEGCGVLFLVKGRGPRRKWCSDRTCGVRFRSRRHYVRVRKPQATERRRIQRQSTS